MTPTADELLTLAAETAREAGSLVVALRDRGVEVADTKSSPIDVVTEADRACEDLIRERLLGVRPDDGFLGEEGDGRTWRGAPLQVAPPPSVAAYSNPGTGLSTTPATTSLSRAAAIETA